MLFRPFASTVVSYPQGYGENRRFWRWLYGFTAHLVAAVSGSKEVRVSSTGRWTDVLRELSRKWEEMQVKENSRPLVPTPYYYYYIYKHI